MGIGVVLMDNDRNTEFSFVKHNTNSAREKAQPQGSRSYLFRHGGIIKVASVNGYTAIAVTFPSYSQSSTGNGA